MNQFSSNRGLIGKSTMAFLTGKSWLVLKSRYTGVDLEQGFWRRLDPISISSVAQFTPNGELTCSLINLLVTLLFQMLAYYVGVEFQRTTQVLKEKKNTFLSFDFTW